MNNFASQSRDLGNIFEYRLGMGFSLNDKVSFNIQLTGSNIAPSSVMGSGHQWPRWSHFAYDFKRQAVGIDEPLCLRRPL